MRIRNGIGWKEASLLGVKVNQEKKIRRIEEYNKNPILCKFCKKPIAYDRRRNKFCSHSCSASLNNFGVVRNFKENTYEEYLENKDKRNNYTKKKCLFCGKETSNFKYCSSKCSFEQKKKNRIKIIEEKQALIDSKKDKWYLIKLRGHKCEVCNNNEWNGQKIPIDVHHIDGNSDNNSLKNVILICPNCHRLTENHGSKNRVNKIQTKRKVYRNKRYNNGLSY